MINTRLTNGSIENYNRFLKHNAIKNILPHRHITSTISLVIGKNSDYLNSVCKQYVSVKRKTDRDIQVNEADQYEEDINDAVEHNGKKLKLEYPSTQGYQQPSNVEILLAQISKS
ncbi:unnamed protein product [Brachionus calyciflorus]|uniref:Uncharacterized protein n=1 Tax=Brachionus calyciflorus TaxID=104777 RepID=A0A813SMQ5_9BILA|nr:unnamed protein product [Brachionus calyciflorus]